MKKKLFLLLATSIWFSSLAQWDGTSSPWTQGAGTQSNPYQISSAANLAYLSDMVASGLHNYQNTYFILTTNINLSNQQWSPIGDSTHSFRGNIDGAGHSITGMLVTSTSVNHKGLIGYLQYGYVKNLTCTGNINLNSTIQCGGIIVAKADNNASIVNCHSYGSVTGASNGYKIARAGGVVGQCSYTTTIKECTNHATVTGRFAGGIVGIFIGSSTTIYSIRQCTNYGALTAEMYCGGIVAYANNLEITECGNLGDLTINSNGGDAYAGGIIGYNANAQYASIALCYNHGDVYVHGNFYQDPVHYYSFYGKSSGIAGEFGGSTSYCYNSGDITSYSTAYSGSYSNPRANSYGIGVVGSCSNCYNTGTLTAHAPLGNEYCYGTSSGNPVNCYYLAGCGATAGGVARSEAQMKSSSFPTLLNQDSTVFIMDDSNYNSGYPVMYYLYNCHAYTDAANQVLTASACLNGHHNGSCDSIGFLLHLFGSSEEYTRIMAPTVTGTTSLTVNNLTWDTIYEFCHVAYWRGYPIYGDTLTFHTLAPGTITVNTNNSEWGTVSGSGVYPIGYVDTLQANAIYPYQFVSWQDGNTDNPRIITVNGNASYTATFAMGNYTVSAQANNSEWGTVSGGGTYLWNTQVTLTALPTTGHRFTQWSDGESQASRVLTVLNDTCFTAIFEPYYYSVTVESNDTTLGTVTGSGVYPYMEQVILEASALPHRQFTQWSDGSTENPRIISVTCDSLFTAIFVEDPQYTVTVISDNPDMGSVSGGGTFYVGEEISISAAPASNCVFLRWSDDNTDIQRTITVTEDVIYTAYFGALHYQVNVYCNDDAMGTVSGGGSYEYGSQATVTATPAAGHHFVNWSNGVEVNPYTFTVYSDVNIIANFERNTGIEEGEETRYTIHTQGYILNVDGVEGESVSVLDILGRKVFETTASQPTQTVQLPSTGVYIVRIGKTFSKKIVVIK